MASDFRMAVSMLGRLPPSSGQRKIFEGQIQNVTTALDKTKKTVKQIYTGPVTDAFRHIYRPEEEGKAHEYFDLVHSKRDYLLLGVHGRTKCSDTEEGKDVHLPCFKYLVASSSVVENVHTVKRIKLEE